MAGNGSKARPTSRLRFVGTDQTYATQKLLRILVVDENPLLLTDIENALWMWPHRLTHTADVDEAVRLCQHLTPSAILIAADQNRQHACNAILGLRHRLPTVPIIAIISNEQQQAPGRFLDQGADAVLLRTEASRPTLHDLLSRLSSASRQAPPSMKNRTPKLLMPWKRSEILGALICDVDGKILDANKCLATWLGYSSGRFLIGNNVVRDVLSDADDWSAWRQVAGDLFALISGNASIKTASGQVMWTQIEVFSAQDHPSYLQVNFVDQTELAMLAAAEC